MKADIVTVLDNGLVIETFKMQPVYQAATTSTETHNYWGGITGYRPVVTQVYVGDKKVPGRTVILCNYPGNLDPAVGQEISFRAMRIGTTNYNGEMLELWDYGKPHNVMVVTTNSPPAAKIKN